MNKAYDLSLLATLSPATPQAAELIRAVQKFKSVTSVGNDLNEAKASVDELMEMRGSVNERPHVARALLMHAVITYSRASHTKAIERFNIGVTRAYSPEQKKLHDGIVDLRDRVLAHFGPGDGWYDERVIYLAQPQGNSITSVHRRTTHHSAVVDNLDYLLRVAIPFVKGREAERAKELDDILVGRPELFKLIDPLRFDPGEFYQNAPGSVERFWGVESFSIEHSERTVTDPILTPSMKPLK